MRPSLPPDAGVEYELQVLLNLPEELPCSPYVRVARVSDNDVRIGLRGGKGCWTHKGVSLTSYYWRSVHGSG